MKKVKKIIKFIWWVINPFNGASFIDRIMPPGGKRRIKYDKKQTEKKYQKKVENYFKLTDKKTAEFWKGIDHRKYLKYEKDLEKAKKDKLTDYEKWVIANNKTDKEIEAQSKKIFRKRPKISIAIPLYNTDTDFFRELLYTVHCQTYSNWELCLADGSPKELTEIKKMVEKDKRIKYKFLAENKGISGNTNEALKMATGKYISLLDHDDMLSIDALYEVVKVINENKNVDFIYSDEDKFHFLDEPRYEPHFKPDYAPDTLRSNNYICHYSVFKKELLDKIGGFKSEFDGAQDYDLILRATEKAKKIVHIPKVLYHWRVHKGSTAMQIEVKPYAINAGRMAIEEHLERLNLKGKVTNGKNSGTYLVEYDVKENPKVSILIDATTKYSNLEEVIGNILNNVGYENFEIVLFSNTLNSDLEKIIKNKDEKFNNYKNKIKFIIKKEKNISQLYNDYIIENSCEYILLFDSNSKIITENWLEKMLGFAERENVGVVGARIYNKDTTTYNAGYVISLENGFCSLNKGLKKDENGYFGREKLIQNLNAISGNCLMTDLETFKKVNGFSIEFSKEFSAVDYCLKVRKLNKLVVYNPTVELEKFENERDIENIDEKNRFLEKWKESLEKQDEYYNKNFDQKSGLYEIRIDKQ